ncbi:MAG: VCBS repeat-containing protein [Planctomycetota bacterium]|nr:MAG: VCBS repeat-containing protein [Planctomycetota bacterium]
MGLRIVFRPVLAGSLLASMLAPMAAQEQRLTHDAPQVMFGADSPPMQRLFDYDADGDWDAVGGRVGDSGGTPAGFENRVWTNNGAGVFLLHSSTNSNVVPPGTQADRMPIAVGDFSGDGRDDYAQAAGEELWLWTAPVPGRLFFGWKYEDLGFANYSRDVEMADFDGDGVADVAVLANRDLRVYWSGGGSTLLPYDAAHNGVEQLLVSDTDGDLLPDFFAVGGWKAVPFSISGHSIAPGPQLDFRGYGPMAAAGDIDGDGDEDLAAFYMPGSGPATVEIFRRVAAGAWASEPPYEGGPAEYLADVDNDGDPDGVCCGGGGGGPDFARLEFPSTYEISINDGGVIGKAMAIPGLGSRSLAGAKDVDGDGDTDLVAGRCVYFNRGAWTATPASNFTSIESEIELADLDGDGDADPWRQSTLNPNVEHRAYRNQGDGNYRWQDLVMEPLPPGQGAGGPRVLGDFDGDGDCDVILGVWQGSTFLYQGLWKNSGGGSFHYAGACTPDGVSFFLDTVVTLENFITGDLEGDGDLDLVMREDTAPGGTSYGRTKVYRNDGTGFLTPAADYNLESFHALADFDGDGLLDALTSSGPLALRLGQPAGAPQPFGAFTPLFGGFQAGYAANLDVRDFNQDGHPDVAAIEYIPQTGVDFTRHPRIFVNDLGLGLPLGFTKTEPSTDASDKDFAALLGADVNLDGRTDLVFGPFGSDRSYRVYLQKSDAEPLLGVSAYEAGVEMVLPGILRDDADGDGDLDLVGEYLSRNVAIHGPDSGARRQYGTGTPGSGGVVPTLGVTGPVRASAAPELRVTGLSGTLAWLAASGAPAVLHNVRGSGATLLVDPSTPGFFYRALPVTGAGSGVAQGWIALPIPHLARLAGSAAYLQALVPDAGSAGGTTAASNGLYLQLGL